ncbi:thioredoxin family protein [Thermodesulfobacteriota bacterium]
MNGLKLGLGSIMLIAFLLGSNNVLSGELIWETTRKAAYLKAVSEKKKILLFGGRGSCGNCRYMRDKVFEAMKPPIKTILEKNFVIWAADVDRSREWYPYVRGMKEFDLPIICVIDPNKNNIYEDRTTGRQDIPDFYSRLLLYVER